MCQFHTRSWTYCKVGLYDYSPLSDLCVGSIWKGLCMSWMKDQTAILSHSLQKWKSCFPLMSFTVPAVCKTLHAFYWPLHSIGSTIQASVSQERGFLWSWIGLSHTRKGHPGLYQTETISPVWKMHPGLKKISCLVYREQSSKQYMERFIFLVHNTKKGCGLTVSQVLGFIYLYLLLTSLG